jgi:Ca2+-binding RTX toxin-like protein
VLDGGSGNDVSIGGVGFDSIFGGLGEDVLIGGFTDYDGNDAALKAIRDEWATSQPYATRRLRLIDGVGPGNVYKLNNSTVHEDAFADQLTGGADSKDWFWANVLEIMDLNMPAGEFVGLS